MSTQSINTSSTTRRRDPEETRKRILTTAFRMFNERLLGDLNSNQIAKEAGVAVGSFYTYFATKEDILLACYDEWVRSEWTSIRSVAGKAFSDKTVGKLVKLLLAEHQQAVIFRRNLNTLCCVSELAQQHRDRQRLQQCRDIAELLTRLGNPAPCLVQLHATLNSCEFLLDVLANSRHTELGLSIKSVEEKVKQLIAQLLKSR